MRKPADAGVDLRVAVPVGMNGTASRSGYGRRTGRTAQADLGA